MIATKSRKWFFRSCNLYLKRVLTPKNFFSSQKFSKFEIDIHRGLHIDSSELPNTVPEFTKMLTTSLAEWSEQKMTGIWLKLPTTKIFLLEAALAQSFSYHHCTKDYIMLTKWLVNGVENKIPEYCTHYVGCAGFVINESNEVLLVKENLPSRKGWGIPGGQVNRNELAYKAAQREVFEETGIKTEFIELLGVRELTNFRFQASELFFLSFLKAVNTEFNLDKYEILDAKWANREELHDIIERGDAWCLTVLDSMRIGYNRAFGGVDTAIKSMENKSNNSHDGKFVYHIPKEFAKNK